MIQISRSLSADFSYSSSLEPRLKECWQKVLTRKEVGFPNLAGNENEWKAIAERAKAVSGVRRVLAIGIGGSSLGTQVVEECFRDRSSTVVTFLESPSPHVWRSVQSALKDWKETHVVIVSKSGNTLETLSWVERLAEYGLTSRQTTVIASPGEGALQQWAKKENIPCLWIPANVGGRFSVLTAAGMFPAALMGLDLNGFREGAKWALDQVELSSQLAAESLAAWKHGLWLTQMWTYSESLKFFGEWWQQLWSESLGKRLDRKGGAAPRVSTPMACRGPRDQHSLVQQLIEGTSDKSVFVNRILAADSAEDSSFRPQLFPQLPIYNKDISLGQVMGVEAQAFQKSLADAKIPFTTITVPKLNEKSLGALFMLWQMTIAQLGEYLEIDAFNQPGVELGKRHAHQLLTSDAQR